MIIKSFKATDVHGYLNFDIKFDDNLTFLVGINGSGKTSVLKLILGLTSPSYHYLNKIQYSMCEVVCGSDFKDQDIVITARQFEDYFQLSYRSKDCDVLSDRILRISHEDSFDFDDSPSSVQSIREVFDGLEITKMIREITTPKFLGLDRRIYEGRSIDGRIKKGRRMMMSIKKYYRSFEENFSPPAIDMSLEEVQNLVFDYLRTVAQTQPQISEQFKTKIFKQSVSFISEYNVEPIPRSLDVIRERRRKVVEAIKNLGIDYLTYEVNSFFDSIESIVEKYIDYTAKKGSKPKSKEIFDEEHFKIIRPWYNNGSQLRRIDELINFSQQYQEQVEQLRAPIKKLEVLSTNFLGEGNKRLSIAPDGEIKVKLKNGSSTNIFELSSGEKQIIIMLAHLIFEEDQKPSGIFIIDEPELSLHLAWQEIFVKSITEASPKTQFILATHSPSIIGDSEAFICQDLASY